MSKLLNIFAWLEVQQHRATVYRVASVIGPLLIAAGLLSSGDVSAVLTVLGALLGGGGNRLALRHSRPRR